MGEEHDGRRAFHEQRIFQHFWDGTVSVMPLILRSAHQVLRRNYPCCTVNHPQGYPKFWAHSFFTDPNGTSLIHAFLGPSTFSGRVGTDNKVEGTIYLDRSSGSSLLIPSQLPSIRCILSLRLSTTKFP